MPILAENRTKSALSSPRIIVKGRLQERVRARLRRLVEHGNVSHAVIGKRLGLSRSAATRIITGNAAISLAHLEGLCEFFQLTAAEFMVEPDALIQPIKPDEAQLLAHFRQLTYTQRTGLLAVLEGRLAQPVKPRRAQFGSVALTEEQQLLVDLYVQSEPQAREGVLKILKGTARTAAHRDPSDPARREK